MYFSKVYMFSVFYSASSHISSHTSSKPRYVSHILMRSYALTLTTYKFLDIEIVMGPTSHIEIAISDNRGNRIILPHATWKAFIERRADIERLMQSTVPLSSSSPIQDLNVELVKICDTENVTLSLYDTCLYMKSTTVLFLFEQCVEHAYYKVCALSQCTMLVKNLNILYHF